MKIYIMAVVLLSIGARSYAMERARIGYIINKDNVTPPDTNAMAQVAHIQQLAANFNGAPPSVMVASVTDTQKKDTKRRVKNYTSMVTHANKRVSSTPSSRNTNDTSARVTAKPAPAQPTTLTWNGSTYSVDETKIKQQLSLLLMAHKASQQIPVPHCQAK